MTTSMKLQLFVFLSYVCSILLDSIAILTYTVHTEHQKKVSSAS